jgi:hypothetical protein
VIVEARIVARQLSPGGGFMTEYTAEIDRVLKGEPVGGTLIVRSPGAVRPDGVGLRIWGAPEFGPGERVLLFLIPLADGRTRPPTWRWARFTTWRRMAVT